MHLRTSMKLPTLLLCTLALAAIHCGDDESTDDAGVTKKDGGPNLPDSGITTDAGNETTDAGNQTTDAGNQTTDAGQVSELPEMQNVTVRDLRDNTATYVDLAARKPKAIVNVVGATVVSDYAHSNGNHSIYVEQGAGAQRAGILVYYSPRTGETAPAVGSTVNVRGCPNAYYSVLQIQYCADSANTQASFSNVQAGTVPALTEADKFAAGELAADSSVHDDHLGMRVQATGSLSVADAAAPECEGANGNFFCVKLSDGVYMKTAFVHSCAAAQLAGPWTDLVGAWDWYESSGNKMRTIVPLTCDELANKL